MLNNDGLELLPDESQESNRSNEGLLITRSKDPSRERTNEIIKRRHPKITHPDLEKTAIRSKKRS